MKRKTKPSNLTLSQGVKCKARELMGDDYKSLTALVEHLILERHESVFGSLDIASTQEAVKKAVEKAAAELNDQTVQYQAGNLPNKSDGTTKRAAVKRNPANKTQ